MNKIQNKVTNMNKTQNKVTNMNRIQNKVTCERIGTQIPWRTLPNCNTSFLSQTQPTQIHLNLTKLSIVNLQFLKKIMLFNQVIGFLLLKTLMFSNIVSSLNLVCN